MLKNQTPGGVRHSIKVINKLRELEETKELYSKVDSDNYDEYLQLLKQWTAYTDNPIKMEESYIGGDQFEIDFTFRASETAQELMALYLTVTLGWTSVVFTVNENDETVMTVEG